MPTFISHSTNPYFHLAVEDWLLREYQGELPVWFIYRNRPCIVVGRFQNPWKECDLGWLREKQLPLVRRPSGGGTVWHDEGNVNFCCVRPLKGFDKNQALEIIKNKLQDFGIAVEINARHDLVVRQTDNTTRKVSGSAYKQTKDRSLHHGTLLIDADLDNLERSLNSPVKLKSTKSISSVRSQVLNLQTLNAKFTSEVWIESFGQAELVKEGDPRFNAGFWQQWGWRLGETPLFEWDFKVDGHEIKLTSHKGQIRAIEWGNINLNSADLDQPLIASTFKDLIDKHDLTWNESEWLKVLGQG